MFKLPINNNFDVDFHSNLNNVFEYQKYFLCQCFLSSNGIKDLFSLPTRSNHSAYFKSTAAYETV